jgi:N-methylhydantoinase A
VRFDRSDDVTRAGVRIGIDIGGTFTDLHIFDERSGALHACKTLTTPEDPSAGLLAGIAEAGARFAFTAPDVRLLLHGTTIATNAVLERRFPRAALLATEGFRDVLEIGRHVRRDLYGLHPPSRPDLIPRDRRIGVAERMRADGSVALPLTEAAIADAVAALRASEAETVAIALLNAHANGTHERALRDAIALACPDLPVSLSCEISPEIREYERTATTALNALLLPVVRAYLRRLATRLAAAGIAAPVLLVQSNGGVCSPAVAAAQPVRLLLSGPSGGAAAARLVAARLDRPDLVGVDMGGTSFDVCVVRGAALARIAEGAIDGIPVRLPMIEMRTIGAGGGSIAAVAPGGLLTVGPASAGARPGPACYGHGGTAPTVTDANLVLGRLDAVSFLRGSMALDTAAASAAIAAHVAAPLGLSVEAAAEGVLALTETALAGAIRLSLFEKGLDPADFALLAFGGAGGLHAIAVAAELGMREVIFPAGASTFSARGILESDIVHDLAASRVLRAEAANLPHLHEGAASLRAEGEALLTADGVAPARRSFGLAADMRYVGQAFELVVPWPDGDGLDDVCARFHTLHRQRFSYADPDAPVEIVTLRLSAIGQLDRTGATAAAPPVERAAPGVRRVFLGGAWTEAAVHRRDTLAGAVAGPAVIEEDYTTLLIPAGWMCAPARDGHLAARPVAA